MRVLLDSHVILWWLTTPAKLRKAAFSVLLADDTEIFVSAASWWELAIKRALGRIRFDFDGILAKLLQANVVKLDVTFAHAENSAALPAHHSDPFDRMLAAQARCEGLVLMTRDKAFELYSVATIPA
ncbi:MAG TPA: type II toxin-antitoxin system VapC family toxin [Rhizomicrobium sp.]